MFTRECDENDFELMVMVSDGGKGGIFADFGRFSLVYFGCD